MSKIDDVGNSIILENDHLFLGHWNSIILYKITRPSNLKYRAIVGHIMLSFFEMESYPCCICIWAFLILNILQDSITDVGI